MKNVNFIALSLIISVSGCASVKGPSGAKFDLQTVCNTSAKTRCSPTFGSSFPLLKQQKTLEGQIIKDKNGKAISFKPDLTAFLGTIVQRKTRNFAEPGTYCGSLDTFENSDFTDPPIYSNNATIDEILGKSSEAGIQADIKAALSAAGVSSDTIKDLKGAINLEAKRLKIQASSSVVQFVEYRIKEATLRKLESAYAYDSMITEKASKEEKNKYKRCMEEIIGEEWKTYNKKKKKQKSEWQMYQSITGFIVNKNTALTLDKSSLSFGFELALKKAVMAQASSNDGATSNGTSNNVEDIVNTRSTEVIKGNKAVSDLLGEKVKADIETKQADSQLADATVLAVKKHFKTSRFNLSTAESAPFFVALGVSYWRSPRYPEIN